jgi:dTDP-4-amino-4,6-dideoxygalactose transaminase
MQPPRHEVPFVDLAAQYRDISAEISDAVATVFKRTDFILGKAVEEFEAEFANYCGVSEAVAVDSGLSALQLSLRAYGIVPGDEVITVANTFIATALAISHAGATPVLVDVHPETYNMDTRALRAAIGPRTRAIIPVHLYGHPAEMDEIAAVASSHGLLVIEDACQAHGARYRGRSTGSLGHAAAFSFYPGKNLGAYGDGGMIVTRDSWIADRLRVLRNYGQTRKYHHVEQGYNHRLDTLQAAVLRVKLRYLDRWNAARHQHARTYCSLLAGSDVACPMEQDYAQSAWHLFVIRVSSRDGLQQYLTSQGIHTGIHYPIPIHLQPAYASLPYVPGALSVTEAYAGQILSLPMYPELSENDIQRVSDAILEFQVIHTNATERRSAAVQRAA